MQDDIYETPTCGKGLAEHAAVPAKIAELLATLADNLAVHIPTIDASDENGRKERRAYVSLTAEFRRIADELRRTAGHMDGYRDLPMAGHLVEQLNDPELARAFEAYVAREAELLELLTAAVERDRRMLDMRTG